MRNLFAPAICGALLLSAGAAGAQATPRVYDTGSVWSISYIEVKPGQLNAYMANINGAWRSQRAIAQKRGDELGYKILQVADPRDNEPNLILMVEFKNWAVRDRTLAQAEADTKAIQGSLDKAMQATIDRGALRTQRGGLVAQELKFIQ